MTCHWCLRQKGKFSTRLDQTRPGVGGGKTSQRVYAFRETASEMSAFRSCLTYICMYGFRELFFFPCIIIQWFFRFTKLSVFCMYFSRFQHCIPSFFLHRLVFSLHTRGYECVYMASFFFPFSCIYASLVRLRHCMCVLHQLCIGRGGRGMGWEGYGRKIRGRGDRSGHGYIGTCVRVYVRICIYGARLSLCGRPGAGAVSLYR